MQKSVSLTRDAFQKNPDGSWACIKNTDIKHNGFAHRVNPGFVFRKSRTQWGIDIVAILEQEDQQKGEEEDLRGLPDGPRQRELLNRRGSGARDGAEVDAADDQAE